MKRSIWIGYEPREAEAFGIARHSIQRHAPDIPVFAIDLDEVRAAGLYYRPHSQRDGRLWDDISDAPMATGFAISRFLTPILAGEGLALFMDCDVLIRSDVGELFDMWDPDKAVMCVQHPNYIPKESIKMDNQLQTMYLRKNWSSVALYACGHPANQRLTVEMINTVPGRNLHAFSWLNDSEIGDLPMSWNWLAGVSDPEIAPDLVHFTLGTPNMPGYESAPYADEWRCERSCWLAGSHSLISHPHPKRNGGAHGIHLQNL